MSQVETLESNKTDLRIALEASPGTLPAYPTWVWMEPNSYDDFGPNYNQVSRQPISSTRARKRGTIVDLEVMASFQSDLTFRNTQSFIEGVMFANFRTKGEQIGFKSAFSQTFTANATTDVVTSTAHGLTDFDGPFRLTTTTTLPGGLSTATDYWIGNTTTDTFQIATSRANAVAGTFINITSTGTGTHTMTREGVVDGTGETFKVNNGSGFIVNGLLNAVDFGTAANNGLHKITGVSGVVITVSGSNLTTEATPPVNARLAQVGYEFASGDAQINSNGDLITTTADCTTFGLVPGEWIYIGGDTAGTQFATAGNNGFACVSAVTATKISFNQWESTHATDSGTGKTIRIFWANRLVKNETGSSIVTKTYQIERTLGAPDDALPNQIQAEYGVKAYMNEMVFTYNTGDKITWDLVAMPSTHELRSGVTGVKSGNRPAIDTDSMFNTSSNVRMNRMKIIGGSTDPFVYLSEASLTINNNLQPNKAISVLGSFSMTPGIFEVSATATAYFTNITAMEAIRDNAEVSFAQVLVKENTGIFFNLPLVSLGEGMPQLALNEPITLPLSINAVQSEEAGFDHTLMIGYYDYLPDAAMAQ